MITYHLEGLCEHHAVQSYDAGVVQGLHGGHFLEEVRQCVRLPGHAAPEGFYCYRQLRGAKYFILPSKESWIEARHGSNLSLTT